MNTTDSKTKNLEVYTRLLKYPTKQEALRIIDGLAKKLKRHKNGLISCIAQAEKNPLIYTKLIAEGYSPNQIPGWFLRPQEEKKPQPQTTEYAVTIRNHSERTQPIMSQITRAPQPRIIMGMQAYDWEEIRKYLDHNQPRERRVSDRIYEEMTREYEAGRWHTHQKLKELRRTYEENKFNKTIEEKLANTFDSRTALQILLTIPKWKKWYQNQTPHEQNKTFESIVHLYRLKLENKLYQENQQRWTEYYNAMWWQGRFQGKW